MESFVTCIVRSGMFVDGMVALIDHCQDSHRYPTEISFPSTPRRVCCSTRSNSTAIASAFLLSVCLVERLTCLPSLSV